MHRANKSWACLSAANCGACKAVLKRDCCCRLHRLTHLVTLPCVYVIQPAMKMAKGIQELTERSPAPPVACHICSDEFEEAYNHEANVFHGKSNRHAHVAACTAAHSCVFTWICHSRFWQCTLSSVSLAWFSHVHPVPARFEFGKADTADESVENNVLL